MRSCSQLGLDFFSLISLESLSESPCYSLYIETVGTEAFSRMFPLLDSWLGTCRLD